MHKTIKSLPCLPTMSHFRTSLFTVSLPRFSDLGMMKPLFSVSLPRFSDLGMMKPFLLVPFLQLSNALQLKTERLASCILQERSMKLQIKDVRFSHETFQSLRTSISPSIQHFWILIPLLFTVSLPRFSDLGMMKPLFSVSLRSVFCAMTLLQPMHNARMRQANTLDLRAMAMPTPLS